VDKHFEILFLDEAFEFLSSLERKHYEKILYNIRKSQVELDPYFSKNARSTFGNLGHYTKDFIIGYLLFGTRLRQRILWLFRHTDLSKKEAKFQTMKFKKQLTLGQNI
jgi:hypothetical protein